MKIFVRKSTIISYYILAFYLIFGFLTFTLYTQAVPQPPNDLCEDAIEVFEGVTPYENIGATDDGPPWLCAAGGADVWFIYEATCTGDVVFSACNNGAQPPTDYDAAMEIFDTGSCMDLAGASRQCDDFGCGIAGSPPVISFSVEFGNQYIIRMGGFMDLEGTGHLEIIPQEDCVPLDTITLSPPEAVNPVFTTHTVTALAVRNSVPVADILIQFDVTSGPNVGLTSVPDNGQCIPNDCMTDSNGEVSWTYSSSILGTDTIAATSEQMEIENVTSNTVTKTWIVVRNIPALSEWGLIAMAGVLGIIAALAIRRKRLAT